MLEQLFAEFADGATRTTDGRWMLGTLAEAINGFVHEPSDYDGAELLAAGADNFLIPNCAISLRSR